MKCGKTLIAKNFISLNLTNEIIKIIFIKYSLFNKKVDILPQSIEHLTFNMIFNQKVNKLPKNLTHLTFGMKFNQKIDNLPKNLTYLTFGDIFNKKVDNLPKNLTHLTFGVNFNQKIDKLYKNLKYLQMGWHFQNKIILPKTLKELSLTCNNNLINNIPEHIEKIYIYFSVYNEDGNTKVENLPSTIKEIVIEDEKFKDYIKIPFGCVLTIKKFE
jgi:hypothetical protein